MPTEVTLFDDGRYVLVTQRGAVDISQIKTARSESLPLYLGQCDRALVDFRLADIDHLRVIDLDDLGVSFKHDVPKCTRMAIVMPPDADRRRYEHLANAHTVCGVLTQLFERMDDARAWLLDSAVV